MDDVARVILAIGSQEVAEEVLHLLDRSGRARVVATAADGRQLAEAVRQLEPDAVVAEPAIAAAGVGSAALLALATRESVASLRAAIGAGAQGFFVWPQERQALLQRVLALAAARRVPERRAIVVAVHAARGGAGCTFVATHLAQAVVRRGATCLLMECDPVFADLTQALGFADEDVRTLADLVPVGDELTESLVSCTVPLPSTLTAQICCFPAVREEWKITVCPSGVNAGCPSACGSFVIRVAPVPSAFIT